MSEVDELNKDSKHPGGRPLTFKSAADLQSAIDAYFDMCDPHMEERLVESGVNGSGETIFLRRKVMTDQVPYTISDLASALKVSRQTLLNYGEREQFFDTVELAKQRCEGYAERQLYGPFANGAKFNLINNYNGKYTPWTDKQSVDHTTKDQPIPLLAGLAPAKLEVDADDAPTADDSASED
ncbi:terminase small subunit [Mycolicibacterium sp. PDY-3]|uniref:terminase small subunit n=1 Tax=Mycolicibacterium sp. PDY-3 TaxID=3376069 RepID=UPI0037B56E89